MKHVACLACGKLPLDGGGCCVILMGVGFATLYKLPCSVWGPPIAGSAMPQPLSKPGSPSAPGRRDQLEPCARPTGPSGIMMVS